MQIDNIDDVGQRDCDKLHINTVPLACYVLVLGARTTPACIATGGLKLLRNTILKEVTQLAIE